MVRARSCSQRSERGRERETARDTKTDPGGVQCGVIARYEREGTPGEACHLNPIGANSSCPASPLLFGHINTATAPKPAHSPLRVPTAAHRIILDSATPVHHAVEQSGDCSTTAVGAGTTMGADHSSTGQAN